MKILVSGASGFIGSALAKRLREETNHEIFGLYRYVADGRYDYYKLERQKIGDLRDEVAIDRIFSEVKPDVVYHLGAMTPVSYSFLAPVEVSEVNYIGSMNIARACVKYEVKHMIHASTSEFYGEQTTFPILENAKPAPLSPYAVAKLAAEEYIRFEARTRGLKYTIIRPYNTYGRANVNKKYFVIERAITQALEDGHIHLYTPTPVRDLLDRDSHVDAYFKCLENEKAIGQEINIGTGRGVTIGKAVDLIASLVAAYLGRDTPIPVSWDMAPDRPYDIEVLICSNQKALELLDWRPLYTLEEGLKKAVQEWAAVLKV